MRTNILKWCLEEAGVVRGGGVSEGFRTPHSLERRGSQRPSVWGGCWPRADRREGVEPRVRTSTALVPAS